MPRRSRGWFTSLQRATRYRLIVPLLRSRNPPEHTARGVAAGVFWGVLPILGLQTVAIVITWTLARRTRWDLSLVQALAWQWVNNPLTMVPLYYLFYATGHVMAGHGWAGGYHTFVGLWTTTMSETTTWSDRVIGIARVLGLPTLVGSLPWATLGAIAAYRFACGFGRRVERRFERGFERRCER
jgi:uncharacterized protein